MSYSDVARRRESDRERAKRYRGRKGVTEGVTESGDSGRRIDGLANFLGRKVKLIGIEACKMSD